MDWIRLIAFAPIIVVLSLWPSVSGPAVRACVNLRRTKVYEVDFEGADPGRSDLQAANFGGANLKSAILDRTGHRTLSVFDRYTITSTKDLQDAARLMGTFSGTFGQS